MSKKTKKTDTRQRILDAAEALFARQGYSGTSTRQIAAEAGISIQTLHYHCAGKKNLYKTILEKSMVPVTEMVNRHVQEMLSQDLNDAAVLEESVTRIVDELFDLLHANPNYAPLFYRQWLVLDQDLRSVEWQKLYPIFREWSKEIEVQLDAERLSGMNLFLLLLSLSWMYWGLFVQPEFIGKYMKIKTKSPDFLALMKDHAVEMTLRMMEQRGTVSKRSHKKPKTKRTGKPGARRKSSTAGSRQQRG